MNKKPVYEYDPNWIRTNIKEQERADLFAYRWGMWQHVDTSNVITYDPDTGVIETLNSFYVPKESEYADSSNS